MTKLLKKEIFTNLPTKFFICFVGLFALSISSQSTLANQPLLSPEENAWLDQHQVIRVSGPKAFPPFQFLGEDGTFQGIANDYVQILAEMFNLKVEIVKGLPWPKVLEKIKKREIDVLSCAAKAPDRDAYLTYTNPHLSFPMVIVTRKDAPFISNIQGLNNLNVALISKVPTYDWLKRDKVKVNPHFVNTPLESLEAVSLGLADATILNLANAGYLIEKNGLTNLKIAAPTSFVNYNLSIAIRKDWPELASIFNKGLEALSQSEHNEIRQKWFAVRYEHGIQRHEVILVILLVSLASAILLSIFYFWNRSLKKEISERKKAEKSLIESEERFKALHDASFGGVIIHDKGLILDCNQGLSDITGYSNSELIGMNGLDLIAPDHLDQVLENIKRGYEKAYEVEGIRKDGSIFPLAIRGKNVTYKGRDARVIEFRDISERKLAKEQLIQSEQKYRNIVEDAPVGVFSSTPAGKFLRSNKLFAQTLGFETPYELINGVNNIADIYVQPEQRAEVQRLVLEDGKINDFEVELYHKNSGTTWLSISMRPIFDESEEVQAYEGFSVNINDRKRAEREQNNLEGQLRQAHKMEAVGTLAGGIAHDFNNILAAIIGFAELVKLDTPESSSAKGHIEEVLKASNRATELIKHILSFSRRETSTLIPVKINLIIKEALKLLRASIPTTIDISENIDPSCGYIFANPTQVHQVLMNLCTNAFQAMEENGGALKVTVKPIEVNEEDLMKKPGRADMRTGTYVKIKVSDTGPGIDPQIIDRIFDPYFTTKEIGKGSGMGLSVTHGIVKSFDGIIEVESKVGSGASFNVYFPQISLKEAQGTTLSPENIKERSCSESVLIVDDEESLVIMNEQRLKQLGYKVTTAIHSPDALELFRAQPESFDLVITDQTMPKMTGIQLAQELLVIRPDLPVILLTGYSSSVNKEQAIELGIKAFVMKPIQYDALAKTIRQVLETSS